MPGEGEELAPAAGPPTPAAGRAPARGPAAAVPQGPSSGSLLLWIKAAPGSAAIAGALGPGYSLLFLLLEKLKPISFTRARSGGPGRLVNTDFVIKCE